MNTRFVLACLTGAVLVHAAVTACSSSSQGTAGAQTTPAAVQVDVETCSQSFTIPTPGGPGLGGVDAGPGAGSGTVQYYAVAAYPGHSAADLAGRVTNWNAIPTDGGGDSNLRPPGWEMEPQSVLYVKDGYVGAPCLGGPGGTTTFIYAP